MTRAVRIRVDVQTRGVYDRTEELPARIVDVAPHHPDHQYAAHRRPSGTRSPGPYHVSHLTTGLRITAGKSYADAAEKARSALADQTNDSVTACIVALVTERLTG